MELLNPHQWQPVPGCTPRCGNRKDLPKAERRHIWLDAGTDTRHRFSGEFGISKIKICARCGADRAESVK